MSTNADVRWFARRAALRVWRGLNPRSTAGLEWKRQGELITFKWDGFVAASSPPALLARHHYESETIRLVLRDAEIGASLELGCGFGRLSPTFAALSNRHVAADINGEAVAAASTAYPDITFMQVDGSSLPYDDQSFDLVATWTVLQHVPPHRIGGLLAEIMRVLSPNGIVLLCEETRNPGAPTAHAWHRTPEFYAEGLKPLHLSYSADIEEIDRIPGLASPGRVMLFEPPGSDAP